MEQENRKRGFMKGRLPLVLVAVLLVLIASVWGVYAKYVYEHEESTTAKAAEFCFTSNYLTAEGVEKYDISTGDADTADFSFELRNFDGLTVSDVDVNYTIVLTRADGNALSGDESVSPATGTISATGMGENVEITLQNLRKDVTYVITAVGRNGYEVTLSATIEVRSDLAAVYKNTRFFDDYVLLTVWTVGKDATVTIVVPANLIPDSTDPALVDLYTDGVYDGTSFTCSLFADTSTSFRFFTDTNPGGLTVTEGDTELVETPLD